MELCSCIAFDKTYGSGSKPVLGNTVDWRSNWREFTVEKKVNPESGHSFVCLDVVGRPNVCRGFKRDGPRYWLFLRGSWGLAFIQGIPIWILTRIILQYCSNVEEALDLIKLRAYSFFGSNLILLDSGGKAVAVEIFGNDIRFRFPSKGAIYATNHFVELTN